MPEATSNSGPAFDTAAHSYDSDFTETDVGRLQRNLVREYLKEKGLVRPGIRVLELNCGTGADAIWMAGMGADVLATDLSGEMVALGRRKWEAVQNEIEGNDQKRGVSKAGSIEFRQMDFRSTLELDNQFDLVFSNFGGLNCISPKELAEFLHHLPKLLKSEGHFIGVIMPRFCLWETTYFLSKFRFREAFRRLRKGPIPAPLGAGIFQDTWYYSPRSVRSHLSAVKTNTDTRPIGFFLPPSYLDPFFKKRHRWLKRLSKWEYSSRHRSWLAPRSDHFLIAVQYFY